MEAKAILCMYERLVMDNKEYLSFNEIGDMLELEGEKRRVLAQNLVLYLPGMVEYALGREMDISKLDIGSEDDAWGAVLEIPIKLTYHGKTCGEKLTKFIRSPYFKDESLTFYGSE